VAYVDLKAAFDSVDRNALWLLLASSGLPPDIINLFKALYTDILNCVRVNGYDSEWFLVLNGVKQGCVVVSDLFLNPMDWLLERTVHRGMVGTSVGSEPFSDLDFVDHVALLSEMLSLLVLALEIMDEEARSLGLIINWSKTKIQTMLDPTPVSNQVTINGHSVEVVESFPL